MQPKSGAGVLGAGALRCACAARSHKEGRGAGGGVGGPAQQPPVARRAGQQRVEVPGQGRLGAAQTRQALRPRPRRRARAPPSAPAPRRGFCRCAAHGSALYLRRRVSGVVTTLAPRWHVRRCAACRSARASVPAARLRLCTLGLAGSLQTMRSLLLPLSPPPGSAGPMGAWLHPAAPVIRDSAPGRHASGPAPLCLLHSCTAPLVRCKLHLRQRSILCLVPQKLLSAMCGCR